MARRTSRGRKALWLSVGISLGAHLLAARLGLMPSVFSLFGKAPVTVQDSRDHGMEVISLFSAAPVASPELPPEIAADPLGEEAAVEFDLAPGGLDSGEGARPPGAAPGAAIRAPVPLTVPWLKYPASALDDGVSGTVRLRLLIGPEGRVAAVEILEGIRPDCDEAAVKAAEGMIFEPAREQGRRVSAWTEYEISFDLGRK